MTLPEAFNRIGVNRAHAVLADGVIDRLVRKTMLKSEVAGIGVCAEKANAVRDSFPHESFESGPISILNDASNDISLALNCADDRSFPGISTSARAALFVPMPVLVVTADVGFINLDDPA